MPLEAYLLKFVQLLIEPWRHIGQVWLGIVPLYVSLLVDEMYERQVTYGRAIANGFVMVWAGLNWALHLGDLGMFAYFGASKQRVVIAWLVTVATVSIGIFTIVLGFRRKDRALCAILGHARFSGYFLIMLYPMQTGMIPWDWPSLAAVLVLALPAWGVLALLGWLLRRASK